MGQSLATYQGLIKSKHKPKPELKEPDFLITNSITTHEFSMLFFGENVSDIQKIINICTQKYVNTKINDNYYDVSFNIYNKNVNIGIAIIETPAKYYTCGNPSSIYRSCHTYIMVANLTNDGFIDGIKFDLANVNRDIKRRLPRTIVGYTHELGMLWSVVKFVNEIFNEFPRELIRFIVTLIAHEPIVKVQRLKSFSEKLGIKFIPISFESRYNANHIFESTILPIIKQLPDDD